jgi:DNA modification methylase
VADFFSGSGTTIMACEQLGRKCRAMEIAPEYVAVALERWATATGGKPELVDKGDT